MKVFVANFNGIFNPIVAFLQIRGDYTATWQEADVLLLWQDVIGGYPEIAKQAKEMGKRVYVAEHGLLSINDYLPPLSRPLIADKMLVWGERSKNWLTQKAGIKEDRIKVVGTTIFDNFKPKKLHDGKNVLFAPRHWDYELAENIEIAIKLKELEKLGNIHIFSKIVEGEHIPSNYPNPISSNRLSGNHLDQCYTALSNADVLVTLGEGTIASMAYYLDIPVISSDHWETKELLGKVYDKTEFFSQVSEACSMVSPDDLNNQILIELQNPGLNRKLRYEFLKDACGYELPRPAVENILEEIYEG